MRLGRGRNSQKSAFQPISLPSLHPTYTASHRVAWPATSKKGKKKERKQWNKKNENKSASYFHGASLIRLVNEEDEVKWLSRVRRHILLLCSRWCKLWNCLSVCLSCLFYVSVYICPCLSPSVWPSTLCRLVSLLLSRSVRLSVSNSYSFSLSVSVCLYVCLLCLHACL